MYMLTNGIQQTEDFNDYKSNHFTAIIKPVSALTWTTSYYFGQEQQQPVDEDAAPMVSSRSSTLTPPTR